MTHRWRRILAGVGAAALLTCSAAAAQGAGERVCAAPGATPLPLAAVRLTGGPLKHAQDLDAKYLLALEPDRMLAYYRERAGLKPKAKPYGGWDGGGRNLTGHIAGHYLSAVSLMYAATGDERFKQRADYIVAELKEVQDKHGDGYLSALEGGRDCFTRLANGQILSGGFDLNGQWAPWYTLHKIYAGLRDAYRFANNKTALEVEKKFAAWAEGILKSLSDEQVQEMLNTEFGGMNEVLADLYHDTGDRRWLDLSYKFEHRSITEPLQRFQDILAGKHGNTQAPKLVGSVDRYLYAGAPADLLAAAFFWDRVVHHHSFATGGHGKDEYFGPPDKLSDRIDGRTAESCNVYNMLKLTRRLFALRPDGPYADFHERALFNHVLASIDPEDGRTCYMVPVGRGVRHEYTDLFAHFTCCVGTGMENHALHGDGLYYESPRRLWVNLYVPSTAEWKAMGVKLMMETDFPIGETATLKLAPAAPQEFTLALRRPSWAGDGFRVSVNGEPWDRLPPPGSYVEIARTWRDGDSVVVALPKQLRLEPLPDNPQRAAILWGPLVLAGDLGPEHQPKLERDIITGAPIVPVFVNNGRPVSAWLKPVDGKPGTFRSEGAGRDSDVTLAPFYQLHRRTYAIYWDFFTPEQWEAQKAAYAAAEAERRRLEAVTVAYAQPGEMQPERDFGYQGGPGAEVIRLMDRPGRKAASWFSFDLPVEPKRPMALVATYYSGEVSRQPARFEILIEGKPLAEQQVEQESSHRFYDVTYPIPAELIGEKTKVAVMFRAKPKSRVAGVFGLRMIRNEPPSKQDFSQ